ncbi:hydroxymethylbilane synthase [Azospirillum baldaniorum]|uniref:Porphobilinogen deaminase n=1 Tax=Azospirillum baldaniorum TaxID=1064539 RepID=A0A9P1JMK0_9PROT|nr:hydroxymethylbilane synthase [Azospirillum baldaniorum]AWJ88744.1 hydroxymethylbilane synthase [Azospirillum baldaniorum]TWA79715.1 hydroxymethylbilane synthase [Azospirillum brasilense]CCC96269.1 hydroxymethylbilane synthase [Azospirillum baldaniorum]
MTQPLRIGTRGSPLALAQAHETRDRLIAAHPHLAAPGAIEIVVFKTTGDRILDRTLAEAGGKGLFTKELEDALLDGRADLAVHSMKDVPTWMPDGLEISTLLPREDTRDAFFSRGGHTVDTLPAGSVVGTAGLRRQAQILERRPDLTVVPFRGNVQSRLAKLEAGEVDATLLALAGLRRLGLTDRITAVLEHEEMLPAVAQGAIGIEIRSADDSTRALLAPLNCAATTARVTAERALLAMLDGSCRTPIAGLATLDGDRLHLKAKVLSNDGRQVFRAERSGSASDAAAIGADAGAEIKAVLPPDFFKS